MVKQNTGKNDTLGKVNDCTVRDPEPFDWYQRFAGVKDLV